MTIGDNQNGIKNFSTLLDELSSIARVRDSIEREYQLIRLSEEAKQRYGIESEAYLDLYGKYYAQASQIVRIRTFGSIVYKFLVGTAALGATLSALNLYGYFSDQRAKAITENWHTIDFYSNKAYDGGRKAAAENLLAYGQILYSANFNLAPVIRMNARPACMVFGLPLRTFDWLYSTPLGSSVFPPIDCRRAELQNSEFRGAKLYESDFSHANLYKADFSPFTTNAGKQIKTEAQRVNFSHANLRGAKFRAADLHESIFYETDLSGADMRDTNLNKIKLCQVIVSAKTLGLDKLALISSSCEKSALKYEP